MAKKINKNLVGLMVLIIMVLLTTTGIVLVKNLPGQDPTKYAADAEKFKESGEYGRAMQTFVRAFQKDSTNPEYLVSAAECAIEIGEVGRARGYIGTAKVKDSRLKSALELELEFELEIAQIFDGAAGRNARWVRIIELAEKMLSIEEFSESLLARRALGVAYLKQRSDDRTYEKKGMAELKRALDLDPSNVEVVTALTQEWLQQAEKKKREADRGETNREEEESLRKNIASTIESAIEKSSGPDDAQKLVDLNCLRAIHMILSGARKDGISEIAKLAEKETNRPDFHSLLGRLYSTLGSQYGFDVDLEKAAAYLQRAVEIDPKDGRNYLTLSQVYKLQRNELKDPDEIQAKREEEKALYERGLKEIEFSKHFRRYRDNAARNYFFNELFAQELDRARNATNGSGKADGLAAAEAWIEKLKEEKNPESIEVRYLVARLLLEKGDVVAATREAEAAKRLVVGGGINGELERLLTALYIQQKQWGAARESLKEVIKLAPSEPGPRIAMGQVLLELNLPSDALRHLKPTGPASVREALRKDRRAIGLCMLAYRQLKQFELAEQESKLLGEGGPDDELRSANGLMLAERYGEAEAKIKNVLEANPENAQGIRLLLSLYERTERYDEMRGLIESLLAKDPKNRLYRRYELLTMKDVSKEARDERIRALIEEEEDEYTRNFSLASFYGAREKPEEMQKHLDKAEAIRPDDANVIDAQLNLALFLKDWKRAEGYVKKHAEMNIDGTEGKIVQGRLALAKGEHAKSEGKADDAGPLFEEAIDLMRAGVQIYPNYSLGWTHLATAYVAAGRISDAKEVLIQALKKDPTNGHANKTMASIAQAEEDENAEKKYLKAAQRWLPNDPWVQRRLREHQEKENPEEGIVAREKQKKDKPDDLENLVRLARLYADPSIAEYDKAAANYREALKVSDNDLALAREVARFYGAEGVNRPAEGEKLLQDLLKAEQKMEDKALVAASLARFYESQNVLATADRWYRAAVSFDSSRDILLFAAEFYARTRRHEDALEYYERALEHSSDSPDVARQTRARIITVLLNAGDLDRAKEKIDAYVERYPNDADGMIFEGAYHRIDGDIQKAQESFNRHLVRDPDNDVALWQRGQLFSLIDRWELAIQDLKKAKALNPDGFKYQHRIALANALLEAGRGEEAIDELKLIYEENSDEQSVASALVDIYTRIQPARYTEAEKLIYQCMRQYPRDYKWPAKLGRLGELSQDWNRAIEGYEQAAEVGQHQPQRIRDLFGAYRKGGRPDAIIQYVKKHRLRQVLGGNPKALSTLAWAYAQAGEKSESFKAFDEALATTGVDFDAYTKVVHDMVLVLGPKAALERAQTQTKDGPDSLDKRRALVHLLRINGRLEEAIAACDYIISHAVRDVDLIFGHLARGMLLSSQARYEDAKVEYEAVLKLDPDQPLALNNLAYELVEKLQNPAEALPYAKRASRLQPDDSNVLDTYGWVLATNGRLGEAVGALLRALEVDRKNLDATYHLGMVYMKQEKWQEAELRLEQAKGLAKAQGRTGDLPKITKALDQLKGAKG
ncbi:MAG: tetratricopeptide repeat protein [Phycisphaerales bacterium]|nr:tetratricopeptide repeat protein [Phycisphaerales bacterium]